MQYASPNFLLCDSTPPTSQPLHVPRMGVANVLGIYRNTFNSSYAQLDELRERKDAQMDKMLDMMKTQSEQQDKLINFITKTK